MSNIKLNLKINSVIVLLALFFSCLNVHAQTKKIATPGFSFEIPSFLSVEKVDAENAITDKPSNLKIINYTDNSSTVFSFIRFDNPQISPSTVDNFLMHEIIAGIQSFYENSHEPIPNKIQKQSKAKKIAGLGFTIISLQTPKAEGEIWVAISNKTIYRIDFFSANSDQNERHKKIEEISKLLSQTLHINELK